MATPYVAGSIACWLEAKPDMTVDDVLEVIAAVNSHDYPDSGNPRHGQGWFNPYEGLRLVLGETGVEYVAAEDKPRVCISGNQAQIYNPGCRKLTVTVCGIDGRQTISSREISEAISTVDLSGLTKGMYLLTMQSPDGTQVSQKFIL